MSKLPKYKLILEPTEESKELSRGFEWSEPEIGFRSQLGGSPSFLQREEIPSCCGQEMTFYAQLDAINDDHPIADCGLIYVFICFDCFECKSFVQSS